MSNIQFWVYTKGLEKKGQWKAIKAEEISKREKTWHFETILACSENLGKGQTPDYETTLYRGPFYIDIDCEEDLTKAIMRGRTAVKALKNLGISDRDIYVWLSGKKGIHITVPMECFTPEPYLNRLPWVYGQLAADLRCEIDTSVYSMGKGRMWRTANMQRENGKYKVAISVPELNSLRAKDYESYCSTPKPDHRIMKGMYIPGIEARWKKAVHNAFQRTQTAVFVNPEDLELLKGEPDGLPKCGQLMKEGRIKPNVGFNQISVQIGKLLGTFVLKNRDKLIREFAHNIQGESYSTPSERESHIRRGLSSTAGYKWSCRSAKSVVAQDPCASCPLVHLLMEEEQSLNPETDKVEKVEWGKAAQIGFSPKPAVINKG